MAECTFKKNDGSCAGCDLSKPPEAEAHPQDDKLRAALDPIRHKLLVMSGKGGVGKSSVAVCLALTLARRGFAVGLMDVDLHGPNVLRMLGLGEALDLTSGQFTLPGPLMDNLKVISIEAMMKNREAAVIWRGPVKHKVIEQFLTEVEWGPLDFLIIDAPPGTGDEPLSVAHTIPDAKAVIVTTPQEIALADVRKSLNFCDKVNMKVVGLVENMSRLVCPDCGKDIPLFPAAGSQRLAQTTGIPLLGSLPFDHQVVAAADTGRLTDVSTEASPFFQEMERIAATILEKVGQAVPLAKKPVREPGVSTFAVPLKDGQPAAQFPQCDAFALVRVKDGEVVEQQTALPTSAHPGLWPLWLEQKGVTHLFAPGIKTGAREVFLRKDIQVADGDPTLPAEDQVRRFLAANPA